MVLGNNFQCSENYPSLLLAGEEDRQKDATWRNLLKLLKEARIDPSTCFFTNAYMGLVEGSDPTRTVPGMSDPAFLQRCRSFLLHQLAVIQPRVILALGTKVPSFIAPLSPQTAHWSQAKTWAQIDARDGAFVPRAIFPGMPHPVSIVCLLHPSFRGPNLHRRAFRTHRGGDAEMALIREAMQLGSA